MTMHRKKVSTVNIGTILDEFSSSDKNVSAPANEYEYNTDDESDGDISKGSIHGNDGGKADGDGKAFDNSDPDVLRNHTS
jgi:hypothetical protein